ncbi:MAG TPA: threonine/serine dehydratase [Chloroflexota bacterium]|nr:threonine/serine dehydratase [Chloroflexota bacterium]
MDVVTRADISAAARRIGPYVRRTPVIDLEAGAFGTEARLILKLELLQHGGSFKARGAFNRILSADVPPAGVIAASGGNHAIAVAYAAQRLGHRAEIFVPTACPPVKVALLHHWGAEVTRVGAVYAEAFAACQTRAETTGALLVHAYNQPEVVAGQGMVGWEFAAQSPELDTVVVAVGGGGLIAGVAAWYAGAARVIGVEPERSPALTRALEAGEPVNVEVGGVAVDSLGASRAGDLAFAIARQHVDRMVLVTDEQIVSAQRALWETARVAAEPGGATALAAILAGAYRPAAGERVGILVCGGNGDPRQLV